jgi:hypothetical protein
MKAIEIVFAYLVGAFLVVRARDDSAETPSANR